MTEPTASLPAEALCPQHTSEGHFSSRTYSIFDGERGQDPRQSPTLQKTDTAETHCNSSNSLDASLPIQLLANMMGGSRRWPEDLNSCQAQAQGNPRYSSRTLAGPTLAVEVI